MSDINKRYQFPVRVWSHFNCSEHSVVLLLNWATASRLIWIFNVSTSVFFTHLVLFPRFNCVNSLMFFWRNKALRIEGLICLRNLPNRKSRIRQLWFSAILLEPSSISSHMAKLPHGTRVVHAYPHTRSFFATVWAVRQLNWQLTANWSIFGYIKYLVFNKGQETSNFVVISFNAKNSNIFFKSLRDSHFLKKDFQKYSWKSLSRHRTICITFYLKVRKAYLWKWNVNNKFFLISVESFIIQCVL